MRAEQGLRGHIRGLEIWMRWVGTGVIRAAANHIQWDRRSQTTSAFTIRMEMSTSGAKMFGILISTQNLMLPRKILCAHRVRNSAWYAAATGAASPATVTRRVATRVSHRIATTSAGFGSRSLGYRTIQLSPPLRQPRQSRHTSPWSCDHHRSPPTCNPDPTPDELTCVEFEAC